MCYNKVTEHESEKFLDFWEARQVCQNLGGELPIINNEVDNNLLYTFAKAAERDAWIGIYEKVVTCFMKT